MNVQVKPTPEQARVNSGEIKRKFKKAISAPSLNPANPTLLDKVDDGPNQLHSQYQDRPLIVDVPEYHQDPVEPGVTGRLRLTWNGIELLDTEVTYQPPLESSAFPMKLTLPASYTSNAGTFRLGYSVRTGGNPILSEPLAISIDKTAPNGGSGGAMVELPADLPPEGITAEYLASHDDRVLVTVSLNYSGPQIGDVVVVYLGSAIPTALVVGTVDREKVTDPITVWLTKAMLEGREGVQTLFYTLADRKGNIGRQSVFRPVNITLTPAPTNLQPPKVPVGDDGLIDHDDALQTVVVIDPYTNWRLGDQVVVAFDGVERPAQAMPETGTTVDLPYFAVLNGDPGKKVSRVTYTIVRGTNHYKETVGYDVEVDLRRPGPVDPTDPPEVVHPLLALPVVEGAKSPTPDELTEEDANQDATASVELYGLSKAGDVVQLYWNGKAAPKPGGEYVLKGDEHLDPKFRIPFTIPWALIEEQGNSDALPVHYTVAHPATNGNIITSGAKSVRVKVLTIMVPKPTFQFPDLNEDPAGNWFNCQSVRQNDVEVWVIVVGVEGNKPELANQALVFTYQAWSDPAGTVPVPGIEYQFTYTPTDEEANNGFVVHIPYDPWIVTTQLRRGSIFYTAQVNGFPVQSERHLGTFWMASAGVTCRF